MVGAKHFDCILIVVVDFLRRFQICEHFGDFGQCFNLGKLPGGFGSATSGHNSSLVPSMPKSKSTQPNSSAKRQRKRSPDTVAHRKPSNTQTLISEFIALSESKKRLATLFTADVESGNKDKEDTTEEAEEKAMRDKLMRSLKQRRKDIAETIDD